MGETIRISVGDTSLSIRTRLPLERVRLVEARIRETLDGVRQGRPLPERELLVLGMLTLTDEILDAEERLARHQEAARRLEALIRKTESA